MWCTYVIIEPTSALLLWCSLWHWPSVCSISPDRAASLPPSLYKKIRTARGLFPIIVIVSVVRSNGQGSLGFVKNEARLCVSFSRARMVLLFVGNKNMTKGNRHLEAALKASRLHRNIDDLPGLEMRKDLPVSVLTSTIPRDDSLYDIFCK
jgi:hypothetical protein